MSCFAPVVSEERRRLVKQLVMRLIAKTVDQQRQIADYQATVTSLTQRLDNANAQLNEFRESAIHRVTVT